MGLKLTQDNRTYNIFWNRIHDIYFTDTNRSPLLKLLVEIISLGNFPSKIGNIKLEYSNPDELSQIIFPYKNFLIKINFDKKELHLIYNPKFESTEKMLNNIGLKEPNIKKLTETFRNIISLVNTYIINENRSISKKEMSMINEITLFLINYLSTYKKNLESQLLSLEQISASAYQLTESYSRIEIIESRLDNLESIVNQVTKDINTLFKEMNELKPSVEKILSTYVTKEELRDLLSKQILPWLATLHNEIVKQNISISRINEYLSVLEIKINNLEDLDEFILKSIGNLYKNLDDLSKTVNESIIKINWIEKNLEEIRTPSLIIETSFEGNELIYRLINNSNEEIKILKLQYNNKEGQILDINKGIYVNGEYYYPPYDEKFADLFIKIESGGTATVKIPLKEKLKGKFIPEVLYFVGDQLYRQKGQAIYIPKEGIPKRITNKLTEISDSKSVKILRLISTVAGVGKYIPLLLSFF